MDWTSLILAIIAAIQECQKNQPAEQIRKNLRSSGPVMRFQLRRGLKKLGIAPADRKEAVQDAIDSIAESADAQLDELIEQASAKAG